jgi:iron(III) transport system substrate-binding protein
MKKFKAIILIAGVAALFGPTAVRAAADDWKEQWESSVAKGKEEGQVVLYGGYNPIYRKYTTLFEKKYPGISIDYIRGGGSQHAVRILSERRAGKYLADVVMGGASTFQTYPDGTFEELRPFLILPEVTDESAWFGNSLSFVDAEGKYVLSSMGSVGQELAYNTQLVDPHEIRSWSDLLNPKWKGKILRHKTNSVSSAFIFFYHNQKLGPAFIARLLNEADVGQTENLRQGVDWLASGKFLLYLDGTPQSIDAAHRRSLPVALLPHSLSEGEIISGNYCCMAVLDRAPHPNATKVFINWVLSREGQSEWQKAAKKNSLRVDISKDELPPGIVPRAGKHYFHVDRAKYQQPEDLEAIKKIEDAAQ